MNIREIIANVKPQRGVPRRKPSRRAALCAGIALLLAVLSQVDLVRQNAQIFWESATGRGWKLHGALHTVVVWSPALRQNRRVVVYLPPGYETDTAERYPVVYLLHGAPGVLDDWLRYGRAPETLEKLCESGKARNMILVFPDGRGVGYLGDSEYVDAPGRQSRGLAVGTFIWRDLPAWIDSHYRTVASRDGRILAGVSTGGYGAVNLGLQHPQVFGALFSFSGYFEAEDSGWARPVWGYHPTASALERQSPLNYLSYGDNPDWRNTYIYIGQGSDERPPYPAEARAFATVLRSKHVPYRYQILPGKHSWDLWRVALTDALTAHPPAIQAQGRHSPP